MKIKEVYELFEGMKVLANTDLKIKPAFLVQKNIPVIEAEIANAEALKKKLFKKYKIDDYNKEIDILKEEEKKEIDVSTDIKNLMEQYNIQEFNKEFTELMEQKSDIKLKKIKADDLGNITIKPIVLNQLKYIVTE